MAPWTVQPGPRPEAQKQRAHSVRPPPRGGVALPGRQRCVAWPAKHAEGLALALPFTLRCRKQCLFFFEKENTEGSLRSAANCLPRPTARPTVMVGQGVFGSCVQGLLIAQGGPPGVKPPHWAHPLLQAMPLQVCPLGCSSSSCKVTELIS